MATGDCFREAFNELQQMEDEGENDIVLCHGVVTNDGQKMMLHAWVEKTVGENAYVFDVANGNEIRATRDAYYGRFMATSVVRYEPQTALMEYAKSMHYGPWDKIFDGMG
jgi:hypothetical protein